MTHTRREKFSLSQEDMEELIALGLESKYGKKAPFRVAVHAHSRLEGYGMNEHEVTFSTADAERDITDEQ